MNTQSRLKWVLLSLGLIATAVAGRQVVTSVREHDRLARALETLEDLEGRMDRVRWRTEIRGEALRDYAEGRASLAEAARRFRQSDEGNEVSRARVRRQWPDLPSDEARYAADVLAYLRLRYEDQDRDEALHARAEADFQKAFGLSPVRIG